MKKLFFVILLAIGLINCSKSGLAADPVKVDGSSTVFPITEAVAEEFGKSGGGKVIVGISGTGGGFKRFCRGETVADLIPFSYSTLCCRFPDFF